MAKRQQKSARKTTRADKDAVSPAPGGSTVEVGASHLLALAIDPFTNEEHCWGSAVLLFSKIREHHGDDVAKRMFKALAAPTKRQRKRLQEQMLWTMYEITRQHDSVGLKKTARALIRLPSASSRRPGLPHSAAAQSMSC
jgi:hypothetical protein